MTIRFSEFVFVVNYHFKLTTKLLRVIEFFDNKCIVSSHERTIEHQCHQFITLLSRRSTFLFHIGRSGSFTTVPCSVAQRRTKGGLSETHPPPSRRSIQKTHRDSQNTAKSWTDASCERVCYLPSLSVISL